MNKAAIICTIFFIAGMILVFVAPGTADEGDSIMHFLYAKYAFSYPSHFFNQWAKPIYVLVAAPFAQLGFTAIKMLNLSLSTISVWLSYKTAKRLDISNPHLAALFAILSQLLIIISLSGLTEPLFACWMMTGIYSLTAGKKIFALTLLSFLPFVRSEGLIILCVILLYLLAKKYYQYIPLLIAGHVVYAIAGYPVHHDLLWPFTTLSYAVWGSAYGSGPWMHFVTNLPEVISVPLIALLILGLIRGLFVLAGYFLFRDKDAVSDEELFLVYGIAIVYFIAHSAFWALGIFNSFGLLRVIVGIIPLLAIICLRGYNAITQTFLKNKWWRYGILALVVIIPFINTKYSFKWKRDFELKADQQAELEMSKYIKQNFPDYKNYIFFFEPAYVSVALDIDYFDTSQHKRFLNAFETNNFPGRCFLIWDDWFAPVEGHVELKQVEDDKRFQFLQTFEEKDYWAKVRTVKLFRKVE